MEFISEYFEVLVFFAVAVISVGATIITLFVFTPRLQGFLDSRTISENQRLQREIQRLQKELRTRAQIIQGLERELNQEVKESNNTSYDQIQNLQQRHLRVRERKRST